MYDLVLLLFGRSVLNQGTSKLQPFLIYSSYASWVFRENYLNAKRENERKYYALTFYGVILHEAKLLGIANSISSISILDPS